jgi:glutamine synthetase
MAGVDGILNKINPGDPLDKDIYGLSPQELANVPAVPPTLDVALNNLKEGSAFLRKGDVFSEDLIETWIDYKYKKELIPMQQRPTPYEFLLYFDI